MSVFIIPELGNVIFYAFVVIVVAAGFVAATVRFAGTLRELIQG